MMLHRFTTSITDIPLPERFTYPFCYTPHPLCILAAKEVQSYLTRQTAWKDELRQGKMFGVLIVQTEHGETGYLAAFSGILAGKNLHPFFVPPVYDLLQPQGFFKIEEENISSINRNIRQLEKDKAYAALSAELARTIQSAEDILATAKAQLKEAKTAREQRRKEKELNAQEEAELIRESQFQKAEYKRLERSWKARITTLQTQTEDWERRISALKSERKTRSAALQQKLFEQFGMLNYRGEVKNLASSVCSTPSERYAIWRKYSHRLRRVHPRPVQGSVRPPNCCNKLICTDGNLLPWPSSGGVIPPRQRYAITATIIRLAKESANLYCNTCCKVYK